ncbi:lipoprotein-anchoring transpeptidase ErfK/SrfK [Texcoconibacillus texcoconensis]|uniref:Lipoprotein-anchoring transpeptidase ErfK/SrfK n=2 Tax=Texcoconibacillus texcoconensis TaxID=1095777 RepID=A0A840QNW3_9BACI|nr:lipoprotein-anchoring transpeptidase ErfK/SrfK [Texcoconibacillus texcoconensis]
MELAVVDEGEIQAIYPVSIGTRFTPTPEGQHTVTVKAVEPYDRKRDIPGGDEDNPLGTRWIGFDAEGTDGRIYGLHGTNDPDSIGDAVTGGCVRLDNESVEDVFSVIPIGTKILIKSDGESFQNTAIKKGAIAP